jgi:Zn-dependent metalloprotease
VSNFLRAKRIRLFLLSFALIAGLVSTQPANAISGPNPTPTTTSLFESDVLTSPESLGRIERDAVKAARIHLIANAADWGVDPKQFQPSVAIDGVAGMSVVRFEQTIAGVEVGNSLLAVTVNKDGSLLSYTKSISDYSGVSQATISASQATNILKSSLAQSLGISIDQVIISKINLVIVDSALVGDVPSGKYLAWRASTSVLNDAASISMTFLSQDGKQVLSSLPFVRHISAEPFVCDLQVDWTQGNSPAGVTSDTSGNRFVNISSSSLGPPLCGVNTSGQGTTATEVGKQNINKTWDYFSSVLGQDINEEKYLGNISLSANGDLTPRISAFVNVCITDGTYGTCPYGNAFWVPWISSECSSGACSGIFLGKDFDHSDDVIAHELAHGVTFALAFSSAMTDTSETAALSEAISDIFGEAMDQLNVVDGEAADPAWKLAEDYQVGGIRSLREPSVLRIDKNWRSIDSHDNSGPVNRLAFLLANGGTVGKVNIPALGSNANSVTINDLCDDPSECSGTVRMSQLVFATTSNLTATASYFEFGRAMNNACLTLLKAKAAGFTSASCKSVQSALIAQGFTSATIAIAKVPAKAKIGKSLSLSTTMKAVNGTKIPGQKLALQVFMGGKWVTKQSRYTNASGKASFSIRLNSKREYRFRIVTYSQSGLYSIKSNQVKTKVS